MRARHILPFALMAATLGLSACGQRGDETAAPAGEIKAEADASIGMTEAPPAPEPVPVVPAPKPATSATAAAGLPVKDDPEAKTALVGSWAGAAETCNSGEAIRFSADGTYGFEGEGGQWALEGDQLRFFNVKLYEMGEPGETDGDPSLLKLLKVTDTAMQWESPSGAKQDFVRCPGVN
jgi:hypothetical protein